MGKRFEITESDKIQIQKMYLIEQSEQKDGKKQNNLNSKTFKMKKTGLISKRSPD